MTEITSTNAVTAPLKDFRLSSYVQAGILALLAAVLYWQTVGSLVNQWWTDSDYSHGFLVVIFSAFLLWRSKKKWMETEVKPSLSGLIFIAGAMVSLILGTLGAELFLARVSLVILIGGLIVYFAGWIMLKAVAGPWGVLFLMIPLPVIVFNQIALPLQFLASRLAGNTLDALGVPALREGNVITLPSISLNVVEACSGIRSLMALITLAVFYGLMMEKRIWVRCMLVVLAIPLAVGINSLRIVGSGLLGQSFGKAYAEGFFHEFSGVVVFGVTLIALVLLHTIAKRVLRKKAVA